MPQPAPRSHGLRPRVTADTHRGRWLREQHAARAMAQTARRFAYYYNSLLLEAVASVTGAAVATGASACGAAAAEVDDEL